MSGSRSGCGPMSAGISSTPRRSIHRGRQNDKVVVMPATLMSKPDLLARLMDLFREKGFDGASLSDISESTGLGKSSLYHHFPNGKEEIALQVLEHLVEQL